MKIPYKPTVSLTLKICYVHCTVTPSVCPMTINISFIFACRPVKIFYYWSHVVLGLPFLLPILSIDLKYWVLINNIFFS